jgi:hypothetical protein
LQEMSFKDLQVCSFNTESWFNSLLSVIQ